MGCLFVQQPEVALAAAAVVLMWQQDVEQRVLAVLAAAPLPEHCSELVEVLLAGQYL
jgi:hypothetical protein